MLIDPVIGDERGIGAILGIIGGGGDPKGVRLQKGLYQITHFSFNHMLPGKWESYADKLPQDVNSYGVCDSPAQFMEAVGNDLAADKDRQFVVSLTQLLKADQEEGGWRWHKWGPYIGKQTPTTEYLHDEPVIEEVWVYHIYEQVL